MAQVKKLSVATVYGKIDLKKLVAAHDKGDALPVMRVIGSAIGSKSGVSSYGDWTCLLGQFQATNSDTGEVSEAAALFLPDVALTPILVALSRPECKGVEFAIDVSAHYVENSKPGGVPYEYRFNALLPPDENDPISRLNARLLALSAPKSESPKSESPKSESPKGGRK
jgi:hypothetical protein